MMTGQKQRQSHEVFRRTCASLHTSRCSIAYPWQPPLYQQPFSELLLFLQLIAQLGVLLVLLVP